MPSHLAVTGAGPAIALAPPASRVAAPPSPRPTNLLPSVPAAACAAAASLVLALASPALAADAADAVPAAASPSEPAAMFTRNCAGCHAGGGNVVAPGATLASPDLAAAGLDSPGAVFKLVYGGKGRMPGYGEGCAPKVCEVREREVLRAGPAGWSHGDVAEAGGEGTRGRAGERGCRPPLTSPPSFSPSITQGQCTFGPRLSDGDVTRLSEYVLAQAAAGWK